MRKYLRYQGAEIYCVILTWNFFSLTCRLDSPSKRSATGLKCFGGGECGGFLGLGARLNQLILYVV
jgi:hypothetical protein